MSSVTVTARLAAAGLTLPPAPQPVANYVGATISAALGQIWIAGQGPMWGAEARFLGRVGAELTLDQGRDAARLTALNLLAHAAALLDGEIDRLTGCPKLFGLVRCPPDFADAAVVLSGAADVIATALGKAQRPALSAIGAPALPIGIPVELDAVFTFR